MAVFLCKMCGGNLSVNVTDKICTCEYCGSTQTLPSINSDKIEGMYQRANQFRMNYEFDKALGLYEMILEENNADAEAYWSVFLCRYGINYVEDTNGNTMLPTVNRFQYASVYSDVDYKAALSHATDEQKSVYESEAAKIADIQKKYMNISEKEEPFEVFICYKETDAAGRRVIDSALANDIYHQLEQKGIKTFFSRITLEDKLGEDYEPYIFSALQSAKIMIVLGTRPEHFQAVWVRNEWSRFIALIAKGEDKTLIPAYKNMDAYDLPKEFSHLQALDMSKLGFMQDLIRGIEKILGRDAIDEAATTNSEFDCSSNNIIDIAQSFIAAGAWEKALEVYEQLLNSNSKESSAYLGELLVEYRVRSLEELEDKLINRVDDIIEETELLSTVCLDRSYKIAKEYEIPGYLTVDRLVKDLKYDLFYKQKVDDIINYRAELEETFKGGLFRYYKRFAPTEDVEAFNRMEARILNTISDKYEERLAVEQGIIKTKTAQYEAFLEKAMINVIEKNKSAIIARDADYSQYKKIVNMSIDDDKLLNAYSHFRAMGDYKDAPDLAMRAKNKISSIDKIEQHFQDYIDRAFPYQ